MAVMGPAAAGKSTLFNSLSCQNTTDLKVSIKHIVCLVTLFIQYLDNW